MRILFAISHYYDPDGGGGHASLKDVVQPRIDALSECLAWIRGLYHGPAHLTYYASSEIRPAGESHAADVVICTTRGKHLIDELPTTGDLVTHHATDAEPLLLGFECQALLGQRLGEYDYYCYLEDDLVLRDPLLFAKLAWFNEQFGDENLLHPRFFEQTTGGAFRRLYLDGDIAPQLVDPYRRPGEQPDLSAEFLGRPITFRRARHPHSGCYFLNAAQMQHWASRPHFLDRDTRFVGPLDSAATLGVLRTFYVYKAEPPWLGFFEIQHCGAEYAATFEKRYKIVPDDGETRS